jgi:hypothetical protein
MESLIADAPLNPEDERITVLSELSHCCTLIIEQAEKMCENELH